MPGTASKGADEGVEQHLLLVAHLGHLDRVVDVGDDREALRRHQQRATFDAPGRAGHPRMEAQPGREAWIGCERDVVRRPVRPPASLEGMKTWGVPWPKSISSTVPSSGSA